MTPAKRETGPIIVGLGGDTIASWAIQPRSLQLTSHQKLLCRQSFVVIVRRISSKELIATLSTSSLFIRYWASS